MRGRSPGIRVKAVNLTRLDELTRAKAWLDGFRPLRPDVAAELRERFEVSLTHHSTAIEGNTLTLSETQIILEKGVTIGGKSVQEHLEVIGHRDALQFVERIASGEEPITERVIREIHSLVMKGQNGADSGAYRTLNVKAAGTGYVYPEHLHIPNLMEEFVAWLDKQQGPHPILFATLAHLRFVTIHPFREGNGRVGRLLMNLLLIRSGYPIAVIPVERRAEYIDSLVDAQSSESTDGLSDLIASCVSSSLKEYLEVCVSAEPERDVSGEIAEWARS